MQINSELPIELLCYNNEYNEYDFVLFHLMEHSVYKNYFIYQRILHPDRLMILDNSAYEYFIKGEQLDIQKFIEVINVLKPDYYILPDKLMDKEARRYLCSCGKAVWWQCCFQQQFLGCVCR